jgi:hypothetical protein
MGYSIEPGRIERMSRKTAGDRYDVEFGVSEPLIIVIPIKFHSKSTW